MMRRVLLLSALLAACSGASQVEEPRCGDGAIDLGETCDDGNTSAGDGCDNLCQIEAPPAASLVGLVAINEIVAKVPNDGPDAFELVSLSEEPLDLGGATVSDDGGNSFTFPAETIVAPGAHFAIDETVFGFGLGGDDALSLVDGNGDLVDAVDWLEGDSPEGKSFGRFPDAVGEFQTLDTPSLGASNVENQANNGLAGLVVLNEIVAKAANDGPDAVELFSLSTEALDLGGAVLTDAGGNSFSFPAGTLLAANARLVVDGTVFGFGLGAADSLTLTDAAGEVVDTVAWVDGQSPEGGSFARVPDGVGEFQTLPLATLGEANVLSLLGAVVINEVVAKAANNGPDAFELFNLTALVLDLGGLTVTDAGGNSFSFAAGTSLDAGAFLVLDQDTFGFGLGAADSLTLADGAGTVLDAVSWVDGQSPEGGSFARVPDGVGAFETAVTSSLGSSNAN